MYHSHPVLGSDRSRPLGPGGRPAQGTVQSQRAIRGAERRPGGAAEDHAGGQPGRVGRTLQNHPAALAGDAGGQRRTVFHGSVLVIIQFNSESIMSRMLEKVQMFEYFCS